jgi:hypothetical protein
MPPQRLLRPVSHLAEATLTPRPDGFVDQPVGSFLGGFGGHGDIDRVGAVDLDRAIGRADLAGIGINRAFVFHHAPSTREAQRRCLTAGPVPRPTDAAGRARDSRARKFSLCNRSGRCPATARRKRSNPIGKQTVRLAKRRSGDRHEQGFKQVAKYRIYCIDGGDRVASAGWIEADGDEAAIAIVRDRHDGYKCELWLGPRLVTRIDLRRQA